MECEICGCPDVKWLRVRTVAKHFKCSPKKIRRLIHSGQLEAARLGREWRVAHKSLDRLVQEGTTAGYAVEDGGDGRRDAKNTEKGTDY